MNMKKMSVNRLVRCAVIAAVYVVVCLALAPFSYGAVQVRVAEALCLLPVFGAEYIIGVTLGCLLANLLGSTVIDVVFGTLATLLACLVTYKLRDIRIKGLAIPASLPPVVFNCSSWARSRSPSSSRIVPPLPPWLRSMRSRSASARSSAARFWAWPWSS